MAGVCTLESCISRGLVVVCEGGQLDRPGPHTALASAKGKLYFCLRLVVHRDLSAWKSLGLQGRFFITDPLSIKEVHIKGPVNLVGIQQAPCTE